MGGKHRSRAVAGRGGAGRELGEQRLVPDDRLPALFGEAGDDGGGAGPPVSLEQALYLIRSTLLALNDANRTGNYTVLRDLASPDFQARNSAADLSENFSDLRRRHFDLFSVALAAPQLSAAPALDNSGMLRLTGIFPTRPSQINFDLLFQNTGGQWRLFGISVATPQVAAQPEPPKAPPQKTAPR